MNIEQQVASLELSKRLRELGLKQESYFLWIIADHPNESSGKPCVQHRGGLESNYNKTPVHDGWTLTSYSAFSVAELGEMLPDKIRYGTLQCAKENHTYILSYFEQEDFTEIPSKNFICHDGNEANARAQLLITLIENDLITPEWREKWVEK